MEKLKRGPFAIDSATTAAYASDMRALSRYLRSVGEPFMLPVAGEQVARFLESEGDLGRAGGARSPATIRRRVFAIRHTHLTAGFDDPTTTACVVNALEEVLVRADRPAASPVPVETLLQVARAPSHDLRGTRDRALILLSLVVELQRHELVALNVEDVEFHRDGMIIRVAAAQPGVPGRTITVANAIDPTDCPCRATQRWLVLAGIAGGPLLRAISRAGEIQTGHMWRNDIPRIVNRHADKIGITLERYGRRGQRPRSR